MSLKKNISVIILAAGFSERMQKAKFLLKFNEKQSFIEKIVEEYVKFGIEDITIVLNKKGIELIKLSEITFPENIKLIINKFPEKERFYSIQIGLKNKAEKESIFLQNSDNPFVSQEILNLLFQNRLAGDVIIPSVNQKGGHPILISEKVSSAIINCQNSEYQLNKFLENFKKIKIETNDTRILLNINDSDAYNAVFKFHN